MKKKVVVKVKPRIREVFKKTTENGGNVTKTMREMKYKQTTINHPSNVTKTKSWAALVKELPDEKLMSVLNDGLEANRQIGAMILIKNAKNGRTEQVLKDNEGMIEVADHQTRHRFLETGLKIKKYLSDDAPIDAKIVVKIVNYGDKKKKK